MEPQWRKSSFSEQPDGACIEIAAVDGEVLMRESDQPGEVLRTSATVLCALLTHARRAEH
ncbi:DUF397 domain-containing protein [Streptomyces sp. DSM 42041]|uniref:DUF397 domain-containing protein n=1 Tax=Streptomyces hazeniae TaxID=3075538 RepID=A0ABU2NRV6_9ACTN|nr:DUF397 domain-containing protein [Streptomyces sp. DSM 42041]MDT0379710.1 DUF397 domain-containing protein [Streptomyces sp. DSM 42041]